MKNTRFRKPGTWSAGFTLVELLVVIAIIAILAAVTLSVSNTVIASAKRAKMANTVLNIQTAGMSYFTEYSVYPVPTAPAPVAGQDYLITDATASAAAWKALIYGLSGNINPYDATTTSPTGAVANTRAIQFLTLKSSDVDSSGGPVNSLKPSSNNPYLNIVIDNDYDGLLGDTGTTGQVPNFTTSTTVNGVTTIHYYAAAAGPSGGIGLWANCNGSTTANNLNFWVRTY